MKCPRCLDSSGANGSNSLLHNDRDIIDHERCHRSVVLSPNEFASHRPPSELAEVEATARLSEYLVKGFTMDDERLKNPPGQGQKDYFDEQLERIRDIRSSERRFYQKVLDIYATSVDYTPNTEMSQQFFATVQNKMHWAAHGQTAAEVIHARVDAHKPFMGRTNCR